MSDRRLLALDARIKSEHDILAEFSQIFSHFVIAGLDPAIQGNQIKCLQPWLTRGSRGSPRHSAQVLKG